MRLNFRNAYTWCLLAVIAGSGAIIGGLVVRADNAFLHYNACVNFGSAAATDPRLANSAAMARCHSIDAWFTFGMALIAGGIAIIFLAGVVALWARGRHPKPTIEMTQT